jgi:hypothetical protein
MTPDPKPEPVSREEIKRQREADERERQRQADHGISAKAICGTEPFPASTPRGSAKCIPTLADCESAARELRRVP